MAAEFEVSVTNQCDQHMTLEATLKTAISRLRSEELENEAEVRLAVVEPILRALNWDAATDSRSIKPEYSVGHGRVDYALLCPDRPQVFIEAKRRGGLDARAEEQLFDYASHNGIPLLVLTDGYCWDFYLSMADGLPEERRFFRLTLADEAEIREYVKFLEMHLDKRRVSSGDARRSAETWLERNRGRERSRKAIPAAWNAVLEEPDDLVCDLLIEKVLHATGARPQADDVKEFLRGVPRVPTLKQPDSPTTKKVSVRPLGGATTSKRASVAYSRHRTITEASSQATPNEPKSGERLQNIVKDLMHTILETFPETLDDNSLRYLERKKDPLGLKLSGHALIRKISDGSTIGGHNRYWMREYAGQWYVCSQWWKTYHRHNARKLLEWVNLLYANTNDAELRGNLLKVRQRLDACADSFVQKA